MTTPSIPLIAWAPDADQATPGIIADAHNYLPTARGYAPDFALMTSLQHTLQLPSDPRGTGFVNNTGTLVGSQAAIHYIGPGVIHDVTRASPYVAVFDVQDYWRFAGFNNFALAVNGRNILQQSAGPATGIDFDDVAGAPRARCIAVQSQFVMLANFHPDDPFPHPDGWYCSAIADHTDWTLDTATFCAQDRLLQTPGPIVRLVAFNDEIIAFKPNSMLRGRFTGVSGAPWAWSVISRSVGCVGHDAVCEADGILYWMADSGVYSFNGGSVQRIRSAPWEWFVARLPTVANLVSTQAAWDPVRRVVRFFYTRNVLEEISFNRVFGGLAYHPDTGRWGPFQTDAAAVVTLAFDDVPQVADETVTRRPFVLGIVRAGDRAIRVWRGISPSAWFETGDIGDDQQMTVLTQARARVRNYNRPFPPGVFGTHKYRMNIDDPLVTGATNVQRQDGKFDFSHSSRWHRVRFDTLGMLEVTAIKLDISQAGRR